MSPLHTWPYTQADLARRNRDGGVWLLLLAVAVTAALALLARLVG